MDERLFPIRDDPDFSAGVCCHGRQVLLGLHYPEVVAYFFDPAGRAAGSEARPVARSAPDRGSFWATDDPEFRSAVAEQLAAWRAELGFRPGVIRVRQFDDPIRCVGIGDGADLFEMADNPDEAEAWAAYRAAGQFEFSFGGRWYSMAGDGRVLST